MSVTDDLLENARAYGVAFDKGGLPMPPGLHIAIVACMDARLNPYGLLGLAEGDAHVIRNAGGVITDDEFKAQIEADTGLRPGWAPESFRDPSADVRQSLARIAANPFIPHKDSVRGFVCSVTEGTLTEIA